MGLDTLRRLMDERKWELAEALADDLMRNETRFAPGEKAYVAFCLCRSRSNQDRYTFALEPGQIGSFLAREARDYDLSGKCLLELAFAQSLVPGQEYQVMDTYHRFLADQLHYSDEVKRLATDAYFNLACMERNCGRHPEALNHFRQAWETAKKAALDPARVEEFCRDYCWQALQMGNFSLAEKLISEGEHYGRLYPQDNRARASLLNDKAWYAFLKGENGQAVSLILDALPLAEKSEDTSALTRCLVTWSQVCERSGDLDSALNLSMWAHVEAQRSHRPELVAEVQRLLRGIRIQDRGTVERVLSPMLRPA